MTELRTENADLKQQVARLTRIKERFRGFNVMCIDHATLVERKRILEIVTKQPWLLQDCGQSEGYCAACSDIADAIERGKEKLSNQLSGNTGQLNQKSKGEEDLRAQIEAAKVAVGESAVVANLKRLGLA